MKSHIITVLSAFLLGITLVAAQPAPPPGGIPPQNAPGQFPGQPGPPMNQGTPWFNPPTTPPPASGGIGWISPNAIVQSAFPSQNNSQSGTVNVMCCGYDAQGIWRVMPLRVTYNWNGAQYNVQVLNAWNPWTDSWNMGVDVPAFNTNYQLRGTTFDFYTVLSTGTFYFNL